MNKTERLQATIKGEKADRPPVALWRHFPVDDQQAETLAAAIIAYQEQFDFDFVKVSPSSSFCLRGWGAEDQWQGDPEGTRVYTRRPIQTAQDWRRLEVLDPEAGTLGEQLRCLAIISRQWGEETPYIQTIFNPLSQAKNLAGGGRLLEHLRHSPEAVLAGLEAITRTTVQFVEAARRRGIAGIFFAVQHASYNFFDEAGYKTFGEAYDRRVLEAAGGLWLNVLHLHGNALIFGPAESYPVQVVNWHDQETEPSLAEGLARIKGAACGGLSRIESLVLGDAGGVAAQARQALQAAGGRRLVVGTGCVVPVVAPYGNLAALRQAVETA
jgi:uroporphyrinogen decarboxylase